MYAYALGRSAINPQVKNVVQDPRFSSVATVAGSGMEAIGIAALDDICRIDVADRYARSVHLVITTISSVGYGDISPTNTAEVRACAHGGATVSYTHLTLPTKA